MEASTGLSVQMVDLIVVEQNGYCNTSVYNISSVNYLNNCMYLF